MNGATVSGLYVITVLCCSPQSLEQWGLNVVNEWISFLTLLQVQHVSVSRNTGGSLLDMSLCKSRSGGQVFDWLDLPSPTIFIRTMTVSSRKEMCKYRQGRVLFHAKPIHKANTSSIQYFILINAHSGYLYHHIHSLAC